jgi:hypothetical protein
MPADKGVRDRLMLLAHDDDHGFGLRIHQPTLDVGLAGATLIDLLLAGWLQLAGEQVLLTPAGEHGSTGDPISDQTLATIWAARRPARQLRTLLAALAPGLYQQVRDTQAAAGILTHTRSWLGRTRFTPTDPMVTTRARGGPRAAVQQVLSLRPGIADRADDAVCALLRVLHLHDALYLGTAADLDPALTAITTRLRHQAGAPYSGIATITDTVDALAGDITVAVYR